MNVILQEDYPSLGYIGDLISVKPGYARNFLIPRGIAVDASSSNGKLLKHRMDGIHAKRANKKAEAEAFGKRLQELKIEFTLKVGEQGKSFGAITARDIEGFFKKEGIDLNKKQIRLYEPLKSAGEYKVEIKLHSEVTMPVSVLVRSDLSSAPKAADPEGAAKGGKRKGERKKRGKDVEEASPEPSTDDTPTE